MHDTAKRGRPLRDALQERIDVLRPADVGRDDGDFRARFFKGGDARTRPFIDRRAAARQDEPSGPLLDEPRGGVKPQCAYAPGDEICACRVKRSRRAVSWFQARETGDEPLALPERDLVLHAVAAQFARERGNVERAGSQVDRSAPDLRVFERDRPRKSPHRSLRDRQRLTCFRRLDRDGVTCHEPQRVRRASGHERLDEAHRAADRAFRDRADPGPLRIEAPQVGDAGLGVVRPRDRFPQQVEVLTPLRVDREAAIRLAETRTRKDRCDCCPLAGERRRKVFADAGPVGKDEPAMATLKGRVTAPLKGRPTAVTILLSPGELIQRRVRFVLERLAVNCRRVRGVAQSLEPVLLASERIRWHRDARSRVRRVKASPVERRTLDVELRHAAEECLPAVVLANGRQPRRRRFVIHALPSHSKQHWMRADLDIHAHLLAFERAHADDEPDRIHDVAQPVFRARELLAGDVPGDTAHERDPGNREPHTPHDAFVLGQHGAHERRVKRVRDRERLGLDAIGAQPCGDLVNRRAGSGDDHLRGGVDRRDGDERLRAGKRLGDAPFVRHDRGHRAAGRQRLHEAAARGDQRQAVFQGDPSGHAHGPDLADAVAHDHIGADAP